MIARPATYRSRKPRLRVRKTGGQGNVPQKAYGHGLGPWGWGPGNPLGKPKSAPGSENVSGPVATPAVVTPTNEPVVDPNAAVAPPATPQAAADRITAREQYGTGMGDINYQLREAARQYGGAGQINQYGYSEDPNHPGVFLDSVSSVGAGELDPNSALAVIQRNQEAQARATNENANQANTFFSGLNLKNQQNVLDDAGRQRLDAYNKYQDAVQRLTTALEGLRGTRDEGYRNADAADFAAAAALPPEAQADDTGEAPADTPATPGAPAKPTINKVEAQKSSVTKKKKPKTKGTVKPSSKVVGSPLNKPRKKK